MWRRRYAQDQYSYSSDSETDDEDEDEFEPLQLNGNFTAWNMDGSSDDPPPEGFSWISFAEHVTGKRRGKCSFSDCCNKAEVGGHLWVKQVGCCIAPICSGCNYHENEKRMQGGNSTLRKGITVIKTSMSDGMYRAPRRYAKN